jgi:diguanylate cyclase (GGDEF)-like protein/PAS domain S-box-containing protein
MDIVRDIVVNVILLFGLVFMVTLSDQKHEQRRLIGKIIFGVVIGVITIIIMMNGWQMESGVSYDTRSVIISVAGIFFSAITSIIAALIAIGYRISVGGDGVYAGVLTIFFSVSIAILWKYKVIKKSKVNKYLSFYLFGLSVHVLMLLSQLTLPYPKNIDVLVLIGPVVLLVYPVATMLLSIAIMNHELRVESQGLIIKSEEKYRTLVSNSQLGIIQFNTKGVIEIANKTFVEILETKKEWVGHDLTQTNDEVLVESLNKALEGHTTIFENLHEGATRNIPLRVRFSPIYSGKEIIGGIGIIEDLTKQYAMEKDIRELQRKDILTKLYNRAAFDQFLFSEQPKESLPVAIATFDINTFQIINTSFGYEVGNDVLIEIASILLEKRRVNHNVKGYRIGGDEFALVILKTDYEAANEIVKDIEEQINTMIKFKFNINISYGISVLEKDDESIVDVFNKSLDNMMNNKVYAGSSISMKTIDLIMNTLFEKSVRERMHSERVSEIARKIAMKYALGTAFTNRVALAGKLHDIGKITVSEDILDKPGRLDDNEYSKIKKHPETGFKILASVAEYLDIANVVLSHHEWWNGKGYPRGLKDHQAPLESRIINVADAFDAMTVTRPYREAFSIDRAIKELKDFAGRQFDPDVVEKIVELYENNDL